MKLVTPLLVRYAPDIVDALIAFHLAAGARSGAHIGGDGKPRVFAADRAAHADELAGGSPPLRARRRHSQAAAISCR